MSLFLDLGEPQHINEVGVSFWLDKGLTEWCTKEDDKGISLPEHKVWIVQTPNGYRTRLLTHKQEILYESTGLENIATKIDMIKASITFTKKRK